MLTLIQEHESLDNEYLLEMNTRDYITLVRIKNRNHKIWVTII